MDMITAEGLRITVIVLPRHVCGRVVVPEARNASAPNNNYQPQNSSTHPPQLTMQTVPYVSVAPRVAPRLHPRTFGHRPPKVPLRPNHDRDIALAVTITLALLIAIGVPLLAILPQKYVTQLPISIIVPLYISPDAGAWNRLYEAYVKYGSATKQN